MEILTASKCCGILLNLFGAKMFFCKNKIKRRKY